MTARRSSELREPCTLTGNEYGQWLWEEMEISYNISEMWQIWARDDGKAKQWTEGALHFDWWSTACTENGHSSVRRQLFRGHPGQMSPPLLCPKWVITDVLSKAAWRCLISNCEPTEEKVRWLYNNAFCLIPDLMRMHNSKECFVNTYNAFRLAPWSAIQSKTLALRESLATYTHSLRVGPVLASGTV